MVCSCMEYLYSVIIAHMVCDFTIAKYRPNKLVQLIAGPSGVSMNTNLTFHRSGTGPAGRRAGRVPSLPMLAIHPLCQPAIPDEGRSLKIYGSSDSPF